MTKSFQLPNRAQMSKYSSSYNMGETEQSTKQDYSLPKGKASQKIGKRKEIVSVHSEESDEDEEDESI